MQTSDILITRAEADYELLDSGAGEKLERFGTTVLSRPDPQALWPKRLPEAEWKKADAYFTRTGERGDWAFRDKAGQKTPGQKMSEKWAITFGGLKFAIKPTPFKHVGLFPEQSVNWAWLREKIEAGMKGKADIEVLNLFGYTGGASLACSQAGAKVVHIDGSKAAVAWARENADLSGLGSRPIRWIVEDARLFVEREIRRGRQYDGIIMDPPAFGHGPDSELWKIEEHFLPLIEDCKKLLKPTPLFFLINGYSAGYSAIAYKNNLLSLKHDLGGTIEIGELAIEESKYTAHAADHTALLHQLDTSGESRLLPAGIFARWSK